MTILLLHAFPVNERMWEPQRETLTGHEVSAPLLYERGRTMAAWAESIAGETDGEFVVVGASMGGYCALALARHVPERVRAMLLIGARPDADSDERRAGRADTIELIRKEGSEGLWRTIVPKLFGDPGAADERLLHRDPGGLIAAVEAIRDRPDSTELARNFDGPLQFVVGEHDPFVSAAELTGFEVREIAAAGHLVNVERPDEFNEILREFLARV